MPRNSPRLFKLWRVQSPPPPPPPPKVAAPILALVFNPGDRNEKELASTLLWRAWCKRRAYHFSHVIVPFKVTSCCQEDIAKPRGFYYKSMKKGLGWRKAVAGAPGREGNSRSKPPRQQEAGVSTLCPLQWLTASVNKHAHYPLLTFTHSTVRRAQYFS